MIITLKIDYEIGQPVYLKTDNEQLARIVTGYSYTGGDIHYILACGTRAQSTHYAIEISDTIDILKKIDS